MLPPQAPVVPEEWEEISVPVPVITPPDASNAKRFGELISPTIWAFAPRLSVAPGPTDKFWPAVPPCAPCQRVFSPAVRNVVPPATVKKLLPALKYCLVAKVRLPPRLLVTSAEL